MRFLLLFLLSAALVGQQIPTSRVEDLTLSGCTYARNGAAPPYLTLQPGAMSTGSTAEITVCQWPQSPASFYFVFVFGSIDLLPPDTVLLGCQWLVPADLVFPVTVVFPQNCERLALFPMPAIHGPLRYNLQVAIWDGTYYRFTSTQAVQATF